MASGASIRMVGNVSAWLASMAVLTALADCGSKSSPNNVVNDINAGGSGTAGASAAGADGCVVDGEYYPVGATYYSKNGGCGASCVCKGQGEAPQCSGGSLVLPVAFCDHGGLRLYEGALVPAIDDCNTCACLIVGASCSTSTESVSCTTLDCTGACNYAGRSYPNGESFPATDGCSQCSCSNGVVNCDNLACACSPSREPWRLYARTSASECADFEMTCPRGTSAFSNACGCGCEQSPDCVSDGFANCQSALDDGGVPNGPVTICPSAVVCPIVSTTLL